MNTNDFTKEKPLKDTVGSFISSYAQRDQNVEFSQWLADQLQKETPGMSQEASEKLAADIIGAVADHDKKLHDLDLAIEDGQSKVEWLAGQLNRGLPAWEVLCLSISAQKSFTYSNLIQEVKVMPANVETMFYVREKPWHGLGTEVQEAPMSIDALILAGLDWTVEQKNVYTQDGSLIPGYKVNLRSTDNAALGIVSDRYKVVQNEDAFQFTDDLLGAGVTYETAGALQGGRKVWMLARMPHRYIIAGDEIAPYLVVMNSHDGSSGIKVAMTPIRVVCQNTLNLALNSAKRIWTTKHTENVMFRVHEAEETLGLAEKYMGELGRGIDALSRIKLTDKKVMEFMQEFFPVSSDLPDVQRKNNLRLMEDMKRRYWDAPDLSNMDKSGYRFINAVSDFATHADPIRRTKNYDENLFLRTVEGNPMIDRAYKMALAAA